MIALGQDGLTEALRERIKGGESARRAKDAISDLAGPIHTSAVKGTEESEAIAGMGCPLPVGKLERGFFKADDFTLHRDRRLLRVRRPQVRQRLRSRWRRQHPGLLFRRAPRLTDMEQQG